MLKKVGICKNWVWYFKGRMDYKKIVKNYWKGRWVLWFFVVVIVYFGRIVLSVNLVIYIRVCFDFDSYDRKIV